IAPYGAFVCRDGVRVLLGVQNEREWVSLCAGVVGKPELALDPRFKDNTLRVANRAALDAQLATAFAAQTSEEMCRRLNQSNVAFGLINELAAVLEHPVLRMIEVFTAAGAISVPAPAAQHSAARPRIGPVPELDQHGAALRAEFAGRAS